MWPCMRLCPDLKSWIVKTHIFCALVICAPSPYPLPLCSHTLWRLWRGDTSKRCRRSGHLGTRNSASSESSAGGKCVHDIREMQSTFNPSPSKSTTLSKKDLSCIVARFIRTQSSQRPRRSSELRLFHHFSLGTSYSKQLRGNFVPWQAFPNVDDLTFWLLYAEEKLLLEMKDRTCSNTCSQMDQIAVCII